MLKKIRFIVMALINLQGVTSAAEGIYLEFEKMINSSIETNVQPCEDFYTYACSGYKVPQFSNVSYDTSDNLNYVNRIYNSKIFNLLATYDQRQDQLPENCQTFVQKMRKYFESCGQVTKRNLTKYLEVVKPGPHLNWPISEELANDNKHAKQWPNGKYFDVWGVLGKFQSYGLSNLIIEQEIEIDAIEGRRIVLKPCRIFINSTLPIMVGGQDILLEMDVKNPEKITEHIKDTEATLSIILNNFLEKDEEIMETNLEDLNSNYSNINFQSFFSQSWGLQLPLNTSIMLRNPDFFQFLNNKFWLAFDKQKLCNYLMIKFLQYVAYDRTNEFEGVPCIEELRKKFDLAVNFLYHHHIFTAQEKLIIPDVMEIFEAEIDMLGKHFNRNNRKFEPSEVDFLMKKLSAIHLNIGNLPELVSCEFVENFYSSVPNLEEDNYYKNHLLMLRFTKSLNSIQNETFLIVSKLKMKSLSNVFYAPNLNMIILPFVNLMEPIYDVKYNNLTKYALLGFILANELAQAFDFHDLMLDFVHGGACLKPNFYFRSSLKCFQQQPVFKLINSMADNVAVDIVKKIVTLKFINFQSVYSRTFWKKYFFLCMAQNFCKNPFDFYAESDRLNQIVMNSHGFSQAFSCPEGSKMNPEEKCEVY